MLDQEKAPVPAPLPTQRAQPHAVNGSVSSVSWIDPKSPIGELFPETRPPATINETFITGSSGFRFSNYLHAWLDTFDSRITKYGFYDNSGIFTSPSFADIPSYKYRLIRKCLHIIENGIEGYVFQQMAGARTVSHEVLGENVGRYMAGFFPVALDLTGGFFPVALDLTGGTVGRYVGSRVMNMPPVWTHLKLRLMANGQRSCEVVEHSLFPSHSFYCDFVRFEEYKARGTEQTKWQKDGWGAGNPWHATKTFNLFQQEYPTGYAKQFKYTILKLTIVYLNKLIRRIVHPMQKIRFYIADIIVIRGQDER